MAPAQSPRLRWSFAIPPDPLLRGRFFYNQAFVLDPTTNPLGAVLSDAAIGIVGSK